MHDDLFLSRQAPQQKGAIIEGTSTPSAVLLQMLLLQQAIRITTTVIASYLNGPLGLTAAL